MSQENAEPFTTALEVRIGDINYGGHMGNDRFLLLFQDARLRFLQSLGSSEADVGDGAGLILTEARLRFKAEVFLGDVLEVTVLVGRLEATRFTLDYVVRRRADGREVAEGSTVLAAFDYGRRRVAPLPAELRHRLAEHTSPGARG